ncbi:MAG TPA: hypothetical protein VKZ92_04850 [Pseudohongiella sp.]|nr:hypothetical protein [Pseudohongiella sp.]
MPNSRQATAAPSKASNSAAAAPGTGTADRIAQSAHEGIDAVSEAAQPAIDRVAAGAHKAVDSAEEFIKPAAEALDEAGLKGEELIATGTDYIRRHPLLSIGMAVAAGYVLNSLLSPGRRR